MKYKRILKRTAVLTTATAMTLAMSVTMLGTSAFSASYKTVYGKAKVKSSGTTVRKSPSTKSGKIMLLEAGKTYKIKFERFTSSKSVSKKKRWVYSSAWKGYVRSDLVSVSYGSKSASTTDALNMRKGPGQDFDSLGLLSKGDRVTVRVRVRAKDNSTWYRITANGKTAYVKGDYLKFTTSGSSNSGGNSNSSNNNSGGNSDGGNSTSNKANNPDATVTADTPVLKATGTVTAATAQVRKTPSAKGTLLKTVKKGKTLTVTSETFTSKTSTSTSRRFVYASNLGGYIARNQVSLSYKNPKKATVSADGGLRTRKGPGTTFDAVSAVASGSSVTAKLRAYGPDQSLWYRIVNQGKAVYVKASFLKFTSSSNGENSGNNGNNNSGGSDNGNSGNGGSYITADGFPSSYLPYLQALHKAHPTWTFTPVKTGLNWSDAVAAMMKNSGTNTISKSFPATYRSTEKGCFNYLTGIYTPKDGSQFVGASERAVRYYMDPRNWLTESGIFMFQSNRYKSYHTAALVSNILKTNKALSKSGVAEMFVSAAKANNISAIYLASTAIAEQGSVTSMVDGSKGVYNVFNIGASDAASGGAGNGIAYAKAQGWTTLKKSIDGGARYIAKSFVSNNQGSPYLEHFNVLNGLSSVGTHVYMTAVYAPSEKAASTWKSVSSDATAAAKVYDFDIPVYSNMPSKNASAPVSSGNNNNYLKSLQVMYLGNSKDLINSKSLNYDTSFEIYVGLANTVSILAGSADGNATVSGNLSVTMHNQVQHATVICTSSSGLQRVYNITLKPGTGK